MMRSVAIASVGCLLTAGSSASAIEARSNHHGWTSIPSEAHVQIGTDPSHKVWPWRVYKSSPFLPPYQNITGNGRPLSDGYVFLTPNSIDNSGTIKQNGNFITDTSGDLVFGMNLSGTTDFRKQYYKGKPHLTYWNGYNTNGANIGHGYGNVTFLDDTYKPFTLSPKLPINTLLSPAITDGFVDIHEHQLTPRNTILLSAYNNTPADLSSVKGPKNGWIADAVVFEVDVATQEILFQWRASDHVPFTASKLPISNATGNGTISAPWDYFHLNSIDAVGDDYLINSRHCWTFFLVSKAGETIFSVEGETGGSFAALPADGTFRWQHHVRAHNVTATGLDISLFDNHNSINDNGTGVTKQLVYHFDLPACNSSTPQLRRRVVTESQPLYVDSQGSYLPTLANGNQFVGYGQLSLAREYGPATDGSDLRWQSQFGPIGPVQSYRGFKQTWSATPAAWDPSLVVEAGKAYVSWNGATDVEAWRVYVGDQNKGARLHPAGVAAKKGFETVFEVPSSGGAKFVQVAAVRKGREVRRSNIVAL